MADKTSTLKVVVDPSGAVSGGSTAAAAIEDVGNKAKRTKKEVDDLTSQLQNMVNQVQGPLNSLRSLILAVFSIEAIMAFGRELYNINSAVQGFTATMMVALGTQKAAAKEFEFLVDIANKYGVSIESLTKTYAKLAAAGKDSNMTMSDLHKIFESMAMASSVLHLSTEEVRLVFYALQQMVSKNTVSMEELRRQLGEKLAGALNLASEAMEVTVKELDKMVRTGNVAADELLPKLADVIMKAFGPAAQFSMKSLNAEMARLHNSWFLLIKTIGENGVVEAAGKAAESLATHLRDGSSGAAIFGQALARLIDQFTAWSQKVTAGDIEQFFQTISNLIDALLPPLKLIGMIISGWAALLAPIVKAFSDIVKAISSGDMIAAAALFTGNPQMIAQWINYKAAVDQATNSLDNFRGANAAVGKITKPTSDPSDPTYGKSPAQQLSDAEALYRASLRSIEIKSKERDAIKELADMESYRAALVRASQNEEVPVENRVAALKTLAAQEKDYLALKKEANGELRENQKAYDAIYKPIDNYIRKLDDEADRLTLSQAQIDALNVKIMLQGVAKKDLAAVTARLTEAQQKWNDAQKYDQWRKELDDLQKQQESYLKTLQDQIDKQLYENATYNMTKQEIREYDIAKLEATLSTKMMSNAVNDAAMIGTREADVTMRQIEALKKLIELKKSGNVLATNRDDLDASIKAQKKIQDSWDRTNDHIANSLTDALLRGFENGKSFAEIFKQELISMFKTLVLKPIIQPIMGDITGFIRTILGFGMAGQKSIADPTGDGTGLLGQALNAGSMYMTGSKLVGAGGMTGQFISGVQAGWSGAALPGQAGFMGPVMPGTTVGGAAGAGQSLGSMAATAAPYLAALAAVMITYDQYKKWGNDTVGKIGVLGGAGAGAAAGFAVGGPIGAAIGAIVGALGGGKLFGRGPVEQREGGISGSISGSNFSGENWQNLHQDGGWFRSDKNWTTSVAMSSAESKVFSDTMAGFADIFNNMGKILGVNASELLAGFSASFKITVKDRSPEEVQKEINEFFDKVFRDQLGLVLSTQSDDLMKYIDKFTGTTAELVDFASALVSIAVAIPKMGITGLSFSNLDLMARSGENVVQTFTRVTTGFNSINAVYKTQIDTTRDTVEAMSAAFASINQTMPRNQAEWEALTATIDLSTEAGRQLFDVMVAVAPAFKSVSDAAIEMMNKIQSQIAQVYGGSFAADFARTRFNAAADAFNAYGTANFGWSGASASQTLDDLLNGRNGAALAATTDPNNPNYLGPEFAALANAMLEAFLNLRTATNANNTAVNNNTTSTNNNTNIQIQTNSRLADLRSSLIGYMKGLLTDKSLSPLTPEQRFRESYAQFNAAYQLAKLGGPGSEEAMASLQQLSDQTLSYGQDIYASSPAYNALFQDIFSKLGEVAGPGAPSFQDAWMRSMPENSTIASAADIVMVTDAVNELITVIKSGILVTDDAAKQAVDDLTLAVRTSGGVKL